MAIITSITLTTCLTLGIGAVTYGFDLIQSGGSIPEGVALVVGGAIVAAVGVVLFENGIIASLKKAIAK